VTTRRRLERLEQLAAELGPGPEPEGPDAEDGPWWELSTLAELRRLQAILEGVHARHGEDVEPWEHADAAERAELEALRAAALSRADLVCECQVLHPFRDEASPPGRCPDCRGLPAVVVHELTIRSREEAQAAAGAQRNGKG
jgi:hypothetical protein